MNIHVYVCTNQYCRPGWIWNLMTLLNPFQAIFPGMYNQLLQIMLYLPKYGKMSLATLAQSHI